MYEEDNFKYQENLFKYMRMGLFLTVFMIFTLPILAHPVLSEISYSECTNTTLSTHFNYVWVNDTEANQTTQAICAFGCNANSGLCNMNPFENSFLPFLFPVVSMILLFFASQTKQDDWPIHLLLVSSALLLLIVPFGMFSDSIPAFFAYPYYLLWIVFFVVMFYSILNLIIRSYKEMERHSK